MYYLCDSVLTWRTGRYSKTLFLKGTPSVKQRKGGTYICVLTHANIPFVRMHLIFQRSQNVEANQRLYCFAGLLRCFSLHLSREERFKLTASFSFTVPTGEVTVQEEISPFHKINLNDPIKQV